MSEQTLYLVRRSFKSGGQLFSAGSLLENLSDVKLAKIRLNEGAIVELPSDKEELERLCHYCEVRLGVDLAKDLASRASEGSEIAEPIKPSASAIPTTPGTMPKPKTVTIPVGTKVTPLKK